MKTSTRTLSWASRLKLFALLVCLASLSGCLRGCTSSRPPIHPNPNMDSQPKYRPQAASKFFYDGATMRQPVEGAVARGELGDPVLFTGKDAAGNFVAQGPLPVGAELVARGEERYHIYCTPCHGGRGNGKGVLFERAQIQAADLRQERLRTMPDGQMFDIITHGLGLMSGYKYPIPAKDRWAIIAFVRQLQREAGS